MEISYAWLEDYIPLEESGVDVEDLCERLTVAGAEVEGYYHLPKPEPLVVGELKEIEEHPRADGLSVCSVDIGDEIDRIVCGAPNLFAGSKVPVLLPGGQLPGGKKIESEKIRGVDSAGMICSKQELGLEEKSAGIWIFDRDLSTGENLNDRLEFDDYVIEFELTSNRSDLLSIYGMAREISVLFDLPLSFPDLSVESQDEPEVGVRIEDAEDTPRYSWRTLRGVSIGPSPLKLQHRLAKVGLRPKNNVVDATNYVMLELGHPLHPFDLEKIDGENIEVRRARRGEDLVTIDGTERKLTEENLLIADEEGPIALAGVMGGRCSEVTKYSSDIFLESACFKDHVIRKSAKEQNMVTDASRRFERGADREITKKALDRTARLLSGQGSLESTSEKSDRYPEKFRPKTVELKKARADSLVGIEFTEDEVTEILEDLGFDLLDFEDGRFEVKVPSFRGDVQREVDLIEEIARIHGYDRIEPQVPGSGYNDLSREEREVVEDEVREVLTGMGLSEVINSGFSTSDFYDPEHESVKMENPMGEKRKRLRSELTPDLLSVAENNFQQGLESVAIFELGKVFRGSDEGYEEVNNLAALLAGRKMENIDGKEVYEFLDLKGVCEEMMSFFGVEDFRLHPGGPEMLHPTRKAKLLFGEDEAGFFGELHPEIRKEGAFPERVYLFELGFSHLLKHLKREGSVSPLPKYPSSKRDISLIAPREIPEREVRETISVSDKVESVYLYDVYRGEQVGEDRKSLTYEITFRDSEKTLEDRDVDNIVERIKKDLKEDGISFRKQ